MFSRFRKHGPHRRGVVPCCQRRCERIDGSPLPRAAPGRGGSVAGGVPVRAAPAPYGSGGSDPLRWMVPQPDRSLRPGGSLRAGTSLRLGRPALRHRRPRPLPYCRLGTRAALRVVRENRGPRSAGCLARGTRAQCLTWRTRARGLGLRPGVPRHPANGPIGHVHRLRRLRDQYRCHPPGARGELRSRRLAHLLRRLPDDGRGLPGRGLRFPPGLPRPAVLLRPSPGAALRCPP
jgi:hypothetical protein